MKVAQTQDKKSTVDSNKRMKTKVTSQASNESQNEGQINIFSPKGSALNLSSPKINFIPSKRSSDLSVSPRKQMPIEDGSESERQLSVGPSNGSTVHDEAVSRYECIATLTEQENKNLRDQNRYLIQKMRKMQERESKVRKLYEKAKKYKVLYQQAQMQVEVLKDECQIYKDQAEQMKKIILNDVYRLKQKVIETQIADNEYTEMSMEQVKKSQASTNENQSAKLTRLHTLSKYLKQEI